MNRFFSVTFTVFFLVTALCLPSIGSVKPMLPDLKSLNQNFAKDITRNLKFLEFRPDNNELMIRISVLLEASGEKKHAAEWLEAVKQKGISQPELEKLLEQTRIRYNLQVVQENSSSPNNEPYDWITGPEKSALVAEAENNMEKAAEEYILLFNSSKNPEYLAKAAERYLWANKSGKALLPFLRLLRYKPSDRPLLLQIARIYAWNSNFEKAAKFFARAQGIRYSRDIAIEHLQAVSAVPHSPEAIFLFEDFLSRYPESHKVKIQFSQLLSASNDKERAFRLLKSIPLSQLDASGLLLLAEEHRSRGNATEAIELALSGLKKTSKRNFSDLFYLNNLLASALEARAEYDSALNASKQALAILSTGKTGFDYSSARTFRLALLQLQASILRRISGDSDALEQYQEILKSDPENSAALLFMGEYSRNKNNLNAARDYFEKAAKITPEDSYTLWSLADLHIKLGDYWKARGVLEKLSRMPDFKDSEMLAETWKQTGAWHLVARHYMKNREKMISENREGLIESLEKAGRKSEAAQIIYDSLTEQPFSIELEERLKSTSDYAPKIWKKYLSRKEELVADYYTSRIASLTEMLIETPDNNVIRAQRADILSYSGNLKAALEDYRQIIKNEPANLNYLNRTAELAEWTSDWETCRAVRLQIRQLEPQNATNTMQLAQANYNLRNFREARKTLNDLEESDQAGISEFFKVAYPVYSKAGEFKKARQILQGAQNDVRLAPEDRKLLNDNITSMKRDIGPVVRADYSLFHDTADISRSNTTFYSRFAVENNRFAELSVNDTAMTRKNSTQRGFRGSEVTLSLSRLHLDHKLTFSIPALITRNGSASKLYLPGIGYSKLGRRSETGISFARLPVFDSPEALLQKLYTDNLNIWHETEISRNTSLRIDGFKRRNSLGFNSTGGSLSIQKNLQYAPFRAIRYTYSFEDGDREDSDLFYLDDYNQFHQISWLGDYDIKISRSRQMKFFWETFAGISYKRDPIYGFNCSLEGEAGNSFYYRIYGGIYSSERNRFDTTDGYRAFNTGLSLEKRFW